MRRFISFMLLLSVLISNTEAHELIMLPTMFTHFQEHNAKDHSLNFSEFLYIHYVDNTSHGDQDDNEDKLPFKGAHYVMSVVAPDSKQDNSYILNIPTTIFSVLNTVNFISSIYSGNIWQPPKLH